MKKFLDKYNIKEINREIEYVDYQLIKVTTQNEFKTIFPEATNNILANSPNIIKTQSVIQNLTHEKNIVYVRWYSEAYKIVKGFPKSEEKKSERFKYFLEHLKNNYTIDNDNQWQVIQSLERGFGIYISPIPRYIKKEIIKLFENNELHTLVVTTAFTEGVNTSAKNIVFSFLSGANKRLSDIDILNVAGRAGRFGKNSIGNIYCINKQYFEDLKNLKNKNNIMLENFNYYLVDKEKPKEELIDYEYEMMEEKYINKKSLDDLKITNERIKQLSLTKSELNISLNVSNKWKVILYSWILESKNNNEYYEALLNITNDEKRTESVEIIFRAIKDAFDNEFENVDVFPSKIYDIQPFDKNNNFTWGRLYKIFNRGSIKEVITNNKKYILTQYNNIIKKYDTNDKYIIENVFINEKLGWILNKYFESDKITLKSDAFYNEAFKFISNIIQYKLPFYIGFFSSIFKLYIEKNETLFDASKIEIDYIVMVFEEGISNKDYVNLIDYGIPIDIIKKIHKNKITNENIIKNDYDKRIFDSYELIILEEYSKLYFS